MHDDLGSRQGTKHTSPDLQKDIQRLMDSLRDHEVYVLKEGRIIDQEKAVVPNAISIGLRELQGPLQEFNKTFKRIQKRLHVHPIVGKPYHTRSSVVDDAVQADATSAATSDASSSAVPQHAGNNLPADSDDEDDDDIMLDHELGLLERDEALEDTYFSLETQGDVALDMDDLGDL